MEDSVCKPLKRMEKAECLMSLPDFIKDFEEYGEHVVMHLISANDALGGYTTVWVDGAHFFAAVVLDNSIDARVAAAQDIIGDYNVVIEKNMRLPWHSVFRRLSDGAIFRVTSKDERIPPNSSAIDMRSVAVEEYTLPTN